MHSTASNFQKLSLAAGPVCTYGICTRLLQLGENITQHRTAICSTEQLKSTRIPCHQISWVSAKFSAALYFTIVPQAGGNTFWHMTCAGMQSSRCGYIGLDGTCTYTSHQTQVLVSHMKPDACTCPTEMGACVCNTCMEAN